jgi:hypothetical protein
MHHPTRCPPFLSALVTVTCIRTREVVVVGGGATSRSTRVCTREGVGSPVD